MQKIESNVIQKAIINDDLDKDGEEKGQGLF
jgi:hypothetical protein